MQPYKTTIKAHILKFFDGHDYKDGKIEISTLTQSSYFDAERIDDAVEYAAAQNTHKNVYISGALFDPDAAPFGRSTDADFYASCMAWADMDEPHDPEALKALYAHCKPSYAVVTARHPHRRIQLWWNLKEAVTDGGLLEEALKGIAAHLRSDPSVTNRARLMRLAGTINHPDERKRAKGRITEPTILADLNNPAVYIEDLINAYPLKTDVYTPPIEMVPKNTPISIDEKYHIQGLDIRLKDGRESFMSNLVYAVILDHSEKTGTWPDENAVFADAWPHYERKVIATVQGGLDKEGRGMKAMRQKIRSKLRLFNQGRIKGHETPVKKLSVFTAEKHTDIHTTDTPIITPQEKHPLKTLPLLYASDVQAVTTANDFVEGLLRDNEFSVIYGESNCGKTFFMIDLAMHVALGKTWRGKEVSQGGVIYAALEGGHGTKNRIVAFKQHYAIKEDIPLAIIPSSINLMDETDTGDVAAFIAAIKAAKQRIGNIRLIVIDTLARAISGGDENSSQDMGKLIIHADAIRAITGAHIAFIHHSGKDAAKGARGHSSLRAAVDTEIEIHRPQITAPSTVKIVKQREMEIGPEMAFTLEHVIIGADHRAKPVTSCIVTPANIVPKERSVTLSPVQKFLLDSLIDAVIKKGALRVMYKDNPPVMAVTYDELREVMEERGFREIMATENKTTAQQIKSATQSARMALKKHGKINFGFNYIWLENEG